MSKEAIRFVRRAKVGGLSAKAVMHQLAQMADAEGRCVASLSQLAKWTEQSKSTVQRRLVELEGAGFLNRIPNERGKVHDRNGYQILLPGVEPELPVVGGMVSLTTPNRIHGAFHPDHTPIVTADHTPMVTGDYTQAFEVAVETPTTTTSSLPSPVVENREEVVNDSWKKLRLVVLREWHGGAARIWIPSEDGLPVPCGLGLEKRHLAALIAFHGAEASEIAVRAAPSVWRDGWPRTLAWFTSERHGGGNFHEALSAGRRTSPERPALTAPSELRATVDSLLARYSA